MKQSLSEKLYLAYRFEFEHNGHIVTANASSLTGKEEILLDGKSISKKRNLGLSSCHKFAIDGTEYELHFNVTGFLFCQVECSLMTNGNLIETKTRSAIDNKKTFIRNLILFFLAGMAFGYLAATIALQVMG
ncbi:hypothetical protein [Idiomarina sp. HP20-50]|uniref:hypothetical protein n=1 Tax=Idiomarina sp. HP20-50 TaxID=3070813 RepID=UPI00294B5FB1|nr:hypothetical protein [Idiomarina sp. HP20-50]MDV6316617.1 hypothetical protein [Idiomarina sp. HP20-50]